MGTFPLPVRKILYHEGDMDYELVAVPLNDDLRRPMTLSQMRAVVPPITFNDEMTSATVPPGYKPALSGIFGLPSWNDGGNYIPLLTRYSAGQPRSSLRLLPLLNALNEVLKSEGLYLREPNGKPRKP